MYCLSWNSYKNNICNGFAQLQQKEEFVDMTLVAEGHLVKVHKSLISLASPYIKNVIKSVPCTHPIIFLANITHEVLCQLLEYIYTGEVRIEIEKLDAFIKAAKDLQLPSIAHDLSHAKSLNNGHSSNAPEEIPIGKKFNITENRSLGYSRSDAAIGSNISDILDTNVLPFIDLAPKKLSNENIKIVPDALPNNIQILENREVKFGFSDAVKTTANDIVLDIDMASSESASNNQNMSLETILINRQSTNSLEALPKVNSIQLLDNRLLDYGSSVETETGNTNNILDTNVPTLQMGDNNHYDYSIDVNVAETDDANNFEDFLKFPEPPVKENNQTQPVELETMYPDKSEGQTVFDVDSTNSTLQLHYTISNRGSLQIILNRHLYSMQYSAKNGTKRRWRCIDYRILHCKAYVDTLNDKISKRKNCHTHPFHDKKIMKKLKANLIFSTLNTAIQESKKCNNMENDGKNIESDD